MTKHRQNSQSQSPKNDQTDLCSKGIKGYPRFHNPSIIGGLMALGIYTLLEAGLLFLNAIAILNEKRFLSRYISGPDAYQSGFGEGPSVKGQIANLVRSVHTVLRVPLIFVNAIVIVFKLLLG